MKKTVFLVTTQIKSFIQTYNNQLKNAYKNVTDDENSYLVLLYEDLAKNLKDKDKFVDDYIAFAEEFNLPYVFYPYYGTFNKALLKCSEGVYHPAFEVTLQSRNNEVVNIIHQISPGCLVLNVNKLKSIDFKFDQNYPTIFYLQDLVEKCYRAKLWCSNCWYLDRLNSYKDLENDTLSTVFLINNKNFSDEQKKYFETNKDCKFKDAQQFIDDFKKWLKGEDWTVDTNNSSQVKLANSNINISIPNELVKKQGDTIVEVKSDKQPEDIKINSIKPNLPNIGISTNSKAMDIVNVAVAEDKKAE